MVKSLHPVKIIPDLLTQIQHSPMNYLAHIVLSGKSAPCQVGNFIGDFVKGKQYERYPAEIRKGILMHRAIDSFTDTHPLVSEAKELLRPVFGRYSGIVTDLYFDHFLAVHLRRFTSRDLRCISTLFYLYVLVYYRHLPVRVKGFVFHFVATNRLCKYRSPQGLLDSMLIMERYKTPLIDSHRAVGFLLDNYADLESLFLRFFPELQLHIQSRDGTPIDSRINTVPN